MSEVRQDQLEKMLDQLSVDEQFILVEYLMQRLRQAVQHITPKKKQDLYGVWRDRFPSDFDLGSVIHEIRNEWKDE